jgi:hypothetical protein
MHTTLSQASHEWVKGRESCRQIHAPSFCFLVSKLFHLLPSHLSSPPSSRFQQLLVAMASILSVPSIRSDSNHRKVRWLLGWQSSKFNRKIRCGSVPLGGLQLGEFIFFTSYALVGLAPLFSFLTMLENYDLQLHHLSPHSFTLVAIFIHFCEMYMGVRPSVRLFQLYHVLHSSGRSASSLGGYYFQHRTKGPIVYITTLSLDKWDRWRDDWVIVQDDIHDRLELPTAAPTGSRNGWEKVLDMQQAYRPVVARIWFLAKKGLTSMMMLFDFLSKRIFPLQLRVRLAWLYTGENDATWLERGRGPNLDLMVLYSMLLKLSTDPFSGDFINPWCLVCQFAWTRL